MTERVKYVGSEVGVLLRLARHTLADDLAVVCTSVVIRRASPHYILVETV